MTKTIPTKVTATALGFAGFAVAIIAGLAAENPGWVILWRALACLFVCQLVGMIIGGAGERGVDDWIERYKADNPPPKALRRRASASEEFADEAETSHAA